MSEENNDMILGEPGSDTEDKVVEKKAAKACGPDNFGMFYIGFENGGEMPRVWRSARWTKKEDAEEAARKFNEERGVKG